MLFIRRGPLILFVRSHNPQKLRSLLSEVEDSVSNLTGDISDLVCNAIEEAGEADSIVAVQSGDCGQFSLFNSEHVFSIADNPTNLLAKIISCGKSELIDCVQPGPSFIIMRVPHPGNKVIEKLNAYYSNLPVEKLSYIKALNTSTNNSTILLFSQRPIDRLLSMDDVLNEALVIPRPPLEVYRELRKNAMHFFTRGLEAEDNNWYEIKINIYDSKDQFFLHLNRLYTVLSDLELGFVLSEEWTRDQAFVLMSVPAYQVKLFTLQSPQEFKKITMGLEYDSEGNRLVDLDVNFRNKKIERNSLPEMRKLKKEESGIMLRNQLTAMMSEQALTELKKLEQEID